MAINRVLLVRHGETDYNISGRWQGHLDVALNADGEYQAQCLAAYLKNVLLDAIYSSDLSRALATAQCVAEGRDLAVIPEPRLREINLGVFQGLTRSQVAELYPIEHERWHHDDNFVVPGGESRLQLQARVVAAFREITEQPTGETVLMVTHGGAIRWLLLHLFSPGAIAGKGIENTSITTIERDGDGWRLVEFASTSHLTIRHNSYTL